MYILVNRMEEVVEVAHNEEQYINRFKKAVIYELTDWIDNNVIMKGGKPVRHIRSLNVITEKYGEIHKNILVGKFRDWINSNQEPNKDIENDNLKEDLEFDEEGIIRTYNLAHDIFLLSEVFTIDKLNKFIEEIDWQVLTGYITVNPESSELKPVTYHE